MNCRECGRSVQEGLRFCPECGADVPRVEVSWTCPSCGSEIKVRSRLCPICGEEAVEEGRRARPVRRPRMKKVRWSPVAQWWVEATDSPQPAPKASTTIELAAPVQAPAEPVPKPAVPVERPAEPATEATPPVEPAAEEAPPVELAAEVTPPVEPAAEEAPPVELAAEVTPPVEPAAEEAPPVEPAAEEALPAEPAAKEMPPVEPAAEVTPPVELAAEVAPPVEPAAEVTPPVELAAEVTPPVEPATEATPPVEPAAEVTPPVELAAEVTPPVELAAEVTPPVELAAEEAPPVEPAAEATPPVELAAEEAPPVEPATEVTPPVQLAAEATPPVELAAEATPPVAPPVELAAEEAPPVEPAEAEVVAEPVLPVEDGPRLPTRRDVEFKPLAERLAWPAAAPMPVAQPAAVADVEARQPAPGKKRAIRPGLLALVAVVAAGALVVVFLLYLHSGGAGLNFQSLLARAANPPAAALTTQPTEVPEALTPTQAPTETVTPLPTETLVPTKTSVPPASEPLVHAVQSGETLRSIAQRYGVSIDELMQANNLSSDVIRLGQRLVIPGQTQPALETGSSQLATHVVQQGENLVMIAQQYSVSLVDLMAANGITDPNLVKVGQELKIPGEAEEVLTGTPAPTEGPTARPTATAMPTTSETVTVTLTPTAAPYEFAAPNLLDPANGETVDGTEGVVVNWTTVGLLDDRSWYVVKSWPEDSAQPTPATIWTRTTAVRIPASYRPAEDATSQRFWWSVTVMRAVEGESPVAISPESEQRWFEWQ